MKVVVEGREFDVVGVEGTVVVFVVVGFVNPPPPNVLPSKLPPRLPPVLLLLFPPKAFGKDATLLG